MSTFKLSKNQEFHFLKRGRRFLSLLYSFNSDIDTKRLKDACVKAIQSVELLNYKLVDVSATFPIQSKGTADVNIDVTFDNEFTIEKFYRSIDRNDNQINPYQHKPLALSLIKSDRIYLILKVSCVYFDNYSANRFVQRIVDIYYNHDIQFEEEIEYFSYSEWQNEILVEEAADENYYHLRLREKESDCINSLTDITGVPDTKMHVEDIWIGDKKQFTQDQLAAVTLKFIGNYIRDKKISVGLIPYHRNHEILNETLGLINTSLPVFYSPEECPNLEDITALLNETATNRDSFNYTLLSSNYDNIQLVYLEVPNSLSYIQSGAHFEAFIPDDEVKDLKIVYIVSDQQICIRVIIPTAHNNELPMLFTDQFRNYVETFVVSGKTELVATSKQIEYYQKNFLSVPGKLTFENHDNVLAMLSESFEKYADNDCIAFEDICLTFTEIDTLSNQMAHFLINELGVNKGDMVALMLPRSINQIIATLGVMKAGACFLSIESSLPDSRKQFIIEDAHVKCTIDLSVMDSFNALKYPSNPIAVHFNQLDAIYCIYTSGSTGLPKGCLINQQNMLNYLNWIGQYWKGNEEKKVGYFTTLSFDFTLTSVFGALLSGSCLNIINEDAELSESLNQLISDDGVSVIKLTPAHIGLLSKETLRKSSPKVFIVGGEALSKKQIEYLRNNNDCLIYNEYGPTEATVGCIVHLVDETNEPYIGLPIPDVNVIIANEFHQPMPIGCAGEILLSGKSVISEYLKPSQLTESKFTKIDGLQGLFYRTGDIGRLTGRGIYEYLGRTDEQVKLNGYRIELAEVEANIKKIENIENAAVVIHTQNENKQLIAFWVSNQKKIDFKSELKKFLPIYMIPSRFIKLDFLPLNKNGKIDKIYLSQLPLDKENTIIPLDTKSESLIADAIAAELKIDVFNIGKESNFISLGGDSIKAIQVLATLRKSQYQISLQDLMGGKTIAFLARNLKKINKQADQKTVTGKVELIPIQHLFFGNNFIEGALSEKSYYNQSQLLEIHADLTQKDLHEVMKKLTEHHDMLRSTFDFDKNGEVQQVVLNVSEIDVKPEVLFFAPTRLDNPINDIETFCEKLKSKLNLQNGPLIKSAYIKELEKTYFFITAHHLITDLVSWNIILEDLDMLLTQIRTEKKLHLPLKTDSYKTWSDVLKNKAIELRQREDSFFWNKILSERVNDISQSKKGFSLKNPKTIVQRVSLEKSAKITALTKENIYLNTQTVILRSIGDGLARVFGKGSYRVHSEGHGRNAYDDVDLSRTVGWFTTTFPIVISCEKERSLVEDFVALGFTLNNLPMDGLSYGILNQVKQLKQENKVSWIEFNYLGDLVDNIDSFSNFSISNLSHGYEASRELNHMADFSVIAYQKDKQLFIEFNYHEQTVPRLKMELLAENTMISIDNFITDFNNEDQQFLLPRKPVTTKGIGFNVVKQLESELGELEDILVLSPLQSGMYFHALAEEDDRAYFWQYAYKIKEAIDVNIFRLTFLELLKRHLILRTVFRNDVMLRPVQVVLKEPVLDFRYEDLSELTLEEQEAKLSVIRDADLKEGFDLANGPLIRLYLIKLQKDVFYRIWSNHHLLLDGWSTQVVLKEFEQIYFELINGKSIHLPDLPSFSTYIDWYQSLPVTESQNYWTEYLSGYQYSLTLPNDSMKQSKEYLAADYFFKINSELTTKISDFANSARVTLNALVQCLWGLIIARQNQVNDVVFGTVISGRSSLLEHADKMVGMLINTIPNRVRFTPDSNFKSLLNEMFSAFIKGEPYHYLPLFEIQKHSISSNELIQNVITYVNYPASESSDSQSMEKYGFNIDEDSINVYETTQFDINILVYQADGLEFNIKYNSAVYSKESISALSALWFALFNRISINDKIDVKNLLAVTEEERSKCLSGAGIGEKVEIPFKNLLEYLEASFLQCPKNICVVYGEEEYTYSEFWNESTQFAHYINETYQLQESDFVGICMPRSAAQLIALLGVIKSGSAYVPFDISWPKDRIDSVVENANLKVLITMETFIAFKQWQNEDLKINVSQNKDISGSNTIYCIYTSGSTGKPKGCKISHSNLLNYLSHAITYWKENESLESAYFSPISFDFTITSILGCWLNKGKLIVYPEDENVYDIVNEVVANPNMDVIKIAPAHVNLIEVEILNSATPKTFIVGGEALTSKHIKKLNNNKNCRIINEYGPTEATVGCITHTIEEDEIPFIGKPIRNTQVFLLNEELELVPYGAAGEIYIAGAGVGQGYLGLKDFTESKFLANPFGDGFIYKTGDLARWNQCGKLHFLGRNDNQVKINGFRVELDEIINIAENHPQVETFYTIVNKDEQEISKLYGYYTGSIDEFELAAYFSKLLPDYMVPSIVKKVDSFDLTVNGKIDREKLSKITPDHEKTDLNQLSSSEELLKKVWSEVLMLDEDKINQSSNFIKLGGDSIKAIRLVVRLREFGFKLQLKSILSSPNLSTTAKGMENNDGSFMPEEEKLNDSFELSPVQRLFFNNDFICGPLKEKNFYHQSRLIKFNNKISAFEVKHSIKKLMDHHDALRLKIDVNNLNSQVFDNENNPQFFFGEFYPNDESVDNLPEYIKEHGIIEVKQKISINDGVMLAAGLYQGKGESYVLISIHHLAVDHISWEFIIQDFISCLQDENKELPQKTHSYKKYCEYFTILANHSNEEDAMNYWAQIENEKEINIRRAKKEKDSFNNYKTQNIIFSINDSNSVLSAVALSASIDIQILCLSALTESLGSVFGEGKFRFHLEGHGRDLDSSIDVSRTVGWFTSITPLLTEKKAQRYGLQEMLNLRDVFNRQKRLLHFYGVWLRSDIAKEKWHSKSWIEFNFLGSSESSLVATMVTDETGNESSSNLSNMADLIFVGELRNGQLHFKLTFEQQILTDDEINKLTFLYKQELIRLATILSESTNIPQVNENYNYTWLDQEMKLSLQDRFGEIENISRLTPLQLGMYFLYASNSDAKAYHWQYGCDLFGELDVKKYKESFGELVRRHGILKTIIRDDIAAEPLQIQLKEIKPDFRFMDVSLNDEEYNEGLIKKLIQEDLDDKFNLSEKPPLRLTLIRLNEHHYYRLWSNHHIILDGWSTGIVLNELEKIYLEKLAGLDSKNESKSDFSAYLSWLDSYDVSSSKTYWHGYLNGIQNIVEINPDKNSLGKFVHKDFSFNIPIETVSQLKEFLSQNQITLNVAVHFFWALILSKHSNDRDVVFGSIVSGRPPEIEGIDQVVGMFINAIPVRIILNEDQSLLNQLKQFQQSFYDSMPHHYVNLGDITSATVPGKTLINNILTFEKESDDSIDFTSDLETPYQIKNEYVFESTNYNLNFIVKPINGLLFHIKYNFSSYSEEKIIQLAADWKTVFTALLDEPDATLQEVKLIEDVANTGVQEISSLSSDSKLSLSNDSTSANPKENQNNKWIESLKELYAEVLDCEVNKIEVEKGFFEMGGHSINAIKILSKLRKHLGLKVNYSSFAKSNRIIDLADILKQADKNELPEITKIENSETYDVSPSQRRMWLLSQLENSGNAYNVYWGFRIQGSFDKKLFEKAILKFIQRHEILRTVYREDSNGKLKQVILNHESPLFNISNHPQFKSIEERSSFITDIIDRPFDLKTGPVIRNYILDGENYTEWFIVLHHIVTDDHTYTILIREISFLYNELIKGNENSLPFLEFQYKDYASWINTLNSTSFFKKEIDFWKNKLEGKITSLNIPTEVSRPKTYLNNGKSAIHKIDFKTTHSLRNFAKDANTTLFSVLLTYLKIVLKAYSNQDSITIGIPLTARLLSQLEEQVGYYLNAVPILTEVDDDDKIEGLLNTVNANVFEAFSHGNISFDDLINELNLSRDMSRNPIFDVWADYHHHNSSKTQGFNLLDCSIEEIKEEYFNRPTKFDLTFVFVDDGENLDLHFEYNSTIYSEEIAKNIISSYLHVLLKYAEKTSERIGNVNCISNDQMDSMNQIFKSSDIYNVSNTIIDVFYKTVDENLDNVAVSTKNIKLTYRELNELSNSLADLLIKNHNALKGDWIAVSLPRNEMVLVSIWAIIKLGAAYVPMEMDLTEERKSFIKNDANVKLVIDEDLIEEFLLMRNLFSSERIHTKIEGSDFVYCMYTSGSTGTPKAVKISHDNLYSSNLARQQYYGNKGLRSFALYSYSFDSSINLFFDTILTGGNLYLYDTPKLDLYQVFSEMNLNRTELLTIPPSLYDLLLDHGNFVYLKKVIVAGEECLSTLVSKHFKMNPDVELYNEYGPTECTVWSLVYKISKGDEDRKRIPIGLPIPYTNILILNKNNRIAPVGSFGELFISGPGVSEHYRGNFIDTDLHIPDLKNYYKTGDLVRINSNFLVEYISRVDKQLKIRGYRVETGEIENAIKGIEGVSMAYVTHIKDASNQTILISYYTGSIELSALKIKLQKKLQEYMIPAFIKKLDHIPINLNGKVDEGKLPKNFSDLIEKGSADIAPNSLAFELSELWSEALGIDRGLIYLDSDFFNLGGNSLKAIKLIHLIVNKYNFQMQLNTLFSHSQFEDFFQSFEMIFKSKTDTKGEYYFEI
jgi:amino acid adenylation domain-containing protein